MLVESWPAELAYTEDWTCGHNAATAEACRLEFRGLFSETRGRNVFPCPACPGGWIGIGNVVVYAHSWGAATAAGVVAAGHDVLAPVTVDPVSWMRPDVQMVADHARTWIDYNATGGEGFSLSNAIAGIGGAWNAAPAPYATFYHEINASHAAAMCITAPAGCGR